GADDFLLWHGLLLCLDLLAPADGLARSATGARIRSGALAAHGQATTVAQAAIGADLDQPLDIQRDLASQLAFDFGFLIDDVAQGADLLVVEVLDAQIRVDVGDPQDSPGGMRTHPEDIRQRDFDPLLTRNVNARDTRHLAS